MRLCRTQGCWSVCLTNEMVKGLGRTQGSRTLPILDMLAANLFCSPPRHPANGIFSRWVFFAFIYSALWLHSFILNSLLKLLSLSCNYFQLFTQCSTGVLHLLEQGGQKNLSAVFLALESSDSSFAYPNLPQPHSIFLPCFALPIADLIAHL